MPVVRTIANNTAKLAVSSILRKIVTFFYFSVVARYTGLHVTGLFYLVLTYAMFFSAFVDFGLSNVLIKMLARNPDRLEVYFHNVLFLKIILSILGIISGISLVNILEYPSITKNLVYIALYMVIIESFATSIYSIFRFYNEVQHEAKGGVLGELFAFVLVSIAVYFKLNPYFIILPVVFDKLFNFLFVYYLFKKKLHLKFFSRNSIKWEIIKKFILIAWPFTLTALLLKVTAIDTALLAHFTSEKIVAFYAIPSKLVTSLRFIPISLASVLFPAFSILHVQDKTKLNQTFLRIQDFLTSIAAPIVVGFFVCAPQIVKLLFGDKYADSVYPLQLMSLGILPSFLIYPIFNMLDASGHQRYNTLIVFLSVTTHVLLSIILIPKLSVVGAAISSVVGANLLFILGILGVKRISHFSMSKYFQNILRVFIASFIMGLCLYLLRPMLKLFYLVPLGVIIFFPILYILDLKFRFGKSPDPLNSRWDDMAKLLKVKKLFQ